MQFQFSRIQSLFLTAAMVMSFSVASVAQNMPEMIRVEGGTFSMGDENELGDSTEKPLHKVTLKTYKIAKTETTVTQWQSFCNATGRLMPDPPLWGWLDNHPIVNVSWDDAVAYCKWLSDSTKKTYRLPTEAEWEYAARGGNSSKGFIYAGGQSMYMIGWFEENANSSTQPVAQKRPNELGLFDMSGNVWEWCQDWYAPYEAADQTNPTGPVNNDNQYFRVLRGGSWNYITEGGRVSNRNYFSPDSHQSDYGFRVVMEVTDENAPAPTGDKKPVEKKEEKAPKKKN